MISSLTRINKDFTIGLLNNNKLACNHKFDEIKKFCNYLLKNDINSLRKIDAEQTLIWKRYLQEK